MKHAHCNHQPELETGKRKALVSAYTDWNQSLMPSAHLTLRPKSHDQNRASFTTEIGCAFADVERSILGKTVFNKKKTDHRYRIHRSVFIEKEDVDIHAHILVHIPNPQTHVVQYWDMDLEWRLREAWLQRYKFREKDAERHFFWQPIESGGINAYLLKECLWFGNTDTWDFRSSYLPKN